jgi:hypothetical protein
LKREAGYGKSGTFLVGLSVCGVGDQAAVYTEDRMQATGRADLIRTDTILIKDGAVFPPKFPIESEQFVPGWKLVKNLNGYALDAMIRQAGWNFFCLAGEIQATVFGIDEHSMIRRAVEQIAAAPKTREFNSLEITRVASKHFLGVRCMSVGAKVRHIQESMFLVAAAHTQKPVGTSPNDRDSNQTIGITAAEELIPIR